MISEKKLGLGLITNEEGKLSGLITDGDIRRAMLANRENFFKLTCAEIMTNNPFTVLPSEKNSNVEKIFKKHLIHSVPVVDETGRILGVCDHFSCMI